jgi:phage gp36-like protein
MHSQQRVQGSGTVLREFSKDSHYCCSVARATMHKQRICMTILQLLDFRKFSRRSDSVRPAAVFVRPTHKLQAVTEGHCTTLALRRSSTERAEASWTEPTDPAEARASPT